MSRLAAAWVATAVVMVALDLLWLGVLARTMYQQDIGHLMAARPNLLAGVAFYVLYVTGLVVFVVAPRELDRGWGPTVALGALFGLVAYGTYDLTNLATLREWPLRLSLVDMAWGALLSAAAAAGGRIAITWATAR